MPSDLTVHPLHFETQPADGPPPHAELLGTGMLVAWAALQGGLAKKHAKRDAAQQLAKRAITGRELLLTVLNGRLMDSDLEKAIGSFLFDYTNSLYDDERDDSPVSKVLGYKTRTDEIRYSNDYLGTFRPVVKNAFLVPDTWQAFDRLAPILDARWEDYQKTKYQTAAPKGLYERAARARDAVKVVVPKQQVVKPVLDAGLTEQLTNLVGCSLAHADVKRVLSTAGLPIGRRIDEQALPKIGVSYMGLRIPIGKKRALGIEHVEFHGKNDKSYIRGLGAEVLFAQYPGPLPYGIRWSDDAAKLKKKLGKPTIDRGDFLEWVFDQRRLYVRLTRKKISTVGWGMPREDDEE